MTQATTLPTTPLVPDVPLDLESFDKVAELLEVEAPWPTAEREASDRLEALVRDLDRLRRVAISDTASRQAIVQFDYALAIGLMIGALGQDPDEQTAEAILAAAAEHIDRRYEGWPPVSIVAA